RAVRAVLADPGRYRAAYDRPGLLENWTWEAQARVLDAVYSRLLPDAPGPLDDTHGAAHDIPGPVYDTPSVADLTSAPPRAGVTA
ncbi:hypothetical protein V6U90_31075, partial [Micromonospora sp. CPCC 206060]